MNKRNPLPIYTKTVSSSITPAQKKKLIEIAEKTDRSLSNLIRVGIAYVLELYKEI